MLNHILTYLVFFCKTNHGKNYRFIRAGKPEIRGGNRLVHRVCIVKTGDIWIGSGSKNGVNAMWCAVHVGDRDEARMERFITGLLPASWNTRCFSLTRSRRKKFGGQWQTIEEKLLPGYLFLVTDKPEAVYRELKKIPEPRMLFSNEEYISTLQEKEAYVMERITDGKGRVAVSGVRIAEDGGIVCLWGPLRKVEGRIRKVDLHRRVAEVEAEFMGERQVLYLGIEIESALHKL